MNNLTFSFISSELGVNESTINIVLLFSIISFLSLPIYFMITKNNGNAISKF